MINPSLMINHFLVLGLDPALGDFYTDAEVETAHRKLIIAAENGNESIDAAYNAVSSERLRRAYGTFLGPLSRVLTPKDYSLMKAKLEQKQDQASQERLRLYTGSLGQYYLLFSASPRRPDTATQDFGIGKITVSLDVNKNGEGRISCSCLIQVLCSDKEGCDSLTRSLRQAKLSEAYTLIGVTELDHGGQKVEILQIRYQLDGPNKKSRFEGVIRGVVDRCITPPDVSILQPSKKQLEELAAFLDSQSLSPSILPPIGPGDASTCSSASDSPLGSPRARR